jgi:NADH:ubiquinone oxidoreductase subunit F (NADH-binding)
VARRARPDGFRAMTGLAETSHSDTMPLGRTPVPRLPRLLAGVPADGRALPFAEHLRVHGPRARIGGHAEATALIRMVAAAGLRGRGGAGYPLADKLSAVARQAGRPIVVVNGAESEPASRKDATLLGCAPHLVLDGAVLAAEVVGAREVVVWLHRDPNGPPSPVRAAIEERGMGRVFIRVENGPARYVSGQSSAAVNYLSGGPALPTVTPPHATERGVSGRPTVVSNVETLAQFALLARHGARWFRSVGTHDEPGTLLVTITGGVRRGAVLEVPFGIPLGHLLRTAGLAAAPQALLVGGYAGSWLPWPEAADLPLTSRDLRAAGGMLGVGLVGVLPADRCGLAETAHLVTWLAGETAGQCGPCVRGLPAIAGALRELADGSPNHDTVRRLLRWTSMVTGRGICHHPDGVAAMVRSALRVFHHEIGAHFAGSCSGVDFRPVLPVADPADELGGP